MQQGFQKSVTVEEITLTNGSRTGLSGLDLELWKQLFDALPNTKRVRIVFNWNEKNVLEFLKIISDFKSLESLHFAISGLKNSGVQKMQDCCNIIDNFPIKAKVVLADISTTYSFENGIFQVKDTLTSLTCVILKEDGKRPKIVQKSHSRYPLSGSSFLPN